MSKKNNIIVGVLKKRFSFLYKRVKRFLKNIFFISKFFDELFKIFLLFFKKNNKTRN